MGKQVLFRLSPSMSRAVEREMNSGGSDTYRSVSALYRTAILWCIDHLKKSKSPPKKIGAYWPGVNAPANIPRRGESVACSVTLPQETINYLDSVRIRVNAPDRSAIIRNMLVAYLNNRGTLTFESLWKVLSETEKVLTGDPVLDNPPPPVDVMDIKRS